MARLPAAILRDDRIEEVDERMSATAAISRPSWLDRPADRLLADELRTTEEREPRSSRP